MSPGASAGRGMFSAGARSEPVGRIERHWARQREKEMSQ